MLLLLGACGLYLSTTAVAGFVFVCGLVVAITLWQERRTERAVAALRSMQSPRAQVVRDGVSRQSIAASEVVPGDLLVLSEGRAGGGGRACAAVRNVVWMNRC